MIGFPQTSQARKPDASQKAQSGLAIHITPSQHHGTAAEQGASSRRNRTARPSTAAT